MNVDIYDVYTDNKGEWNSLVAFYLYFILIFINCERIYLRTKPSQNDKNINSVSSFATAKQNSYRIFNYFKFYDKKCR